METCRKSTEIKASLVFINKDMQLGTFIVSSRML